MQKRQKNRKKYRFAHYWGHIMEYWGLLYLFIKGYSLLAFRHKTPFGEIDAIMYYRGQIILCEMKYRRTKINGEIPIKGKQIAYYHQALPWVVKKFSSKTRHQFHSSTQKYTGRVDGVIITGLFTIHHFQGLPADIGD